jgi:hypothetical protein
MEPAKSTGTGPANWSSTGCGSGSGRRSWSTSRLTAGRTGGDTGTLHASDAGFVFTPSDSDTVNAAEPALGGVPETEACAPLPLTASQDGPLTLQAYGGIPPEPVSVMEIEPGRTIPAGHAPAMLSGGEVATMSQ